MVSAIRMPPCPARCTVRDISRMVRSSDAGILWAYGNGRAYSYREKKIMNIQNVLVPVDFSSASQMAVDFASTFAKSLHAQLTLLHVASNDSAARQDANTRLQQLSKMLPSDGADGLAVHTRIRTGTVED
jgi:K+-sensing histidine kinase KdpD